MTRCRFLALFVASVTVLGLVGCSAGEKPQPAAPPAAAQAAPPAVPAGVAQQYAQVNEEIHNEGGEVIAGPWRIGYIVEPAEPWHQMAEGQHSFREPAAGETHHIEIIPFEASRGRIVPDVPIRLEVVDATGQVVDAKQLNFYYAEFFHYANNFSIPTPGRYTLRVRLDVPTFPRHGEQGEQPALSEGANVEFRDVELKTD